MPSAWYARSKVFKRDRFGIVDGVDIDFRHKSLNPGEWHPPPWDDSPDPPLDHPYIWFPWFGEFDPAALRRQALKFATNELKIAREEAPERKLTSHQEIRDARLQAEKKQNEDIERYIAINTPECLVFEGDKIRVDRVEKQIVGSEFDHEDDYEIRMAYLSVIRPDGTTDSIDTPIVYKRSTKFLSDDGSKSYFGVISARILQHFRINALKEIALVPKVDSFAYKALRKAYLVEAATRNGSGEGCGGDRASSRRRRA
jgi:hypothetical protein